MFPKGSLLLCLVLTVVASFSFASETQLVFYEKSSKEHLGDLILNHALNDDQKKYVATWRVDDPSWWRDPRRNNESLVRFNRLLNIATHPQTTEETLHSHPELFGIEYLAGDAASGHQGWLRIDHRLRPDLLVFEKRMFQHLTEVFQNMGGPQSGNRAAMDADALAHLPWFVDEQGNHPDAATIQALSTALKQLFPRSQRHHLDGAERLADLHAKMQACSQPVADCFSSAMWRQVKTHFTQEQNRINRFLATIDGPLADRLVRHLIQEATHGHMQTMVPIMNHGLPDAYLAAYTEAAGNQRRASSWIDPADRISSLYRLSLCTVLVNRQPAFAVKKQRAAGPRRLTLNDFLANQSPHTVVDYGLPHRGMAYLTALRGQGLDVQMQFVLTKSAENRTATTRRTEGKRNYHPDFTLPDTLVAGSTIRHDDTLRALFGEPSQATAATVTLSVAPLLRLYPKTIEQRKQPLVTMGNVWHERVQMEEIAPNLFQGRINGQQGPRTFLLPLITAQASGFPLTAPLWEARVTTNDPTL